MNTAEYDIRRRNEEVFEAIRWGFTLDKFTVEDLSVARLYTGGWSEGQKIIERELARRAS